MNQGPKELRARKPHPLDVSHGTVSIEATSMRNSLEEIARAVAAAVASFKAGEFDTTCEAITFLTSFFSDHETEILESKVDLTPLEELYEAHEFHKLMKFCFDNENTAVAEVLLVHLQQIIVFVDFQPLFTIEFFLPSLLECFLSYDGPRCAQFFVLLERILPRQLHEDASFIYENLERLYQKYESLQALSAWLDFLLSLLGLPARPEDLGTLIKLAVIPDDDSPDLLHKLYVITKKAAKAAFRQDLPVLTMFERCQRDLLVVLLKKPVQDNEVLVIDRVRLLETLLRVSKGRHRDQLYLLSGRCFDFDFATVAGTDDVDRLPYVFRLYEIIAEIDPSFLLGKVARSRRIVDQVTHVLEEGSFHAKAQALKFVSAAVRVPGMLDFLKKVISCENLFDFSSDLPQMDPTLAIAYLLVIQTLVQSTTHDMRLREILMKNLDRTKESFFYLHSENMLVEDMKKETLVILEEAERESEERYMGLHLEYYD